jgi:hypothetical protein
MRLSVQRWLHCIDIDPTSHTYGYCDRDYWAWKIKDFNNGTLQAGLSAFLDCRDLFPEIDPRHVIEIILRGTQRLQRSNGSFEEAYPLESSCCVTALILFNLLYSYFHYQDLFDDSNNQILRKLINKGYSFLQKVEEAHGKIANHQATIAFAQLLCQRYLGNNVNQSLITQLLSLQHEEGWFLEYSGADPGYQTLLNHYLFAYLTIDNTDHALFRAHQKSMNFCSLFCFQDGSYAGELGSRGTHIVYPSGTLLLSQASDFSYWFTEHYSATLDAVTPLNVDINNFVPVLNSWALFHRHIKAIKEPQISAEPQMNEIHSLPAAGFEFRSNHNATLVISKNTAVIKICRRSTADESWDSLCYAHWAYRDRTTQHCLVSYETNENGGITLLLGSRKANQHYNNGLKMSVIRLIALCIYPFPFLQKIFKSLLAKLLVSVKTPKTDPVIKVRIHLTSSDISIDWHQVSDSGRLFELKNLGFQTHMASANTFKYYGT